ncbi:helix-turn-helix domain-containing protein [Oceanospirillum sediminis]|uniref:Helix-turn-helix domain-containing protein n=1 Tax=Oceanospirillum sediminis TaxID=2760088 RepID=A0A839IXX0_9GAMM|nr:helix-turn-helix domain-containing protein [Oceanospirillum sediminis]MBB1489530.1 helix-turn-helix domain-containing protein [Oceanospirillum sediminis]
MNRKRKVAANSENLRIGSQIRDLRKAKGVTLAEIAESIQRSVGYISQVERGVSSLPIPVLQSICDVLGVQISWFFHSDREAPEEELNHIVRKSARRSLSFSDGGIREELLSPRLSGHLQMILTTFSPGAKGSEARKLKGDEGGLVQSGAIELCINDQCFILRAGDSFTLGRDDQYRVRNASEVGEAVVIWNITGGY